MRLKAWLAVLGAVLASISVAHAQLYWAFTMVDTVELASLKMGYYYVLCPQGTYAVAGGASTDSVAMALLANGPLLGETPLWKVPDGKYSKGPDGWLVSAANAGSKAERLTVVAVCAPVEGIVTIVASAEIPIGTWGGAYATGCPSGTVVVSGGAATIAPLAYLDTSSPAIAGQFINAVGDGEHALPSGWHGGAYNGTATSQLVKAAAICIPRSEIDLGGTLVGTAVQGPGVRLGTHSCGVGTLALGAGISEDGPALGQIQSFAPRFPSLPRFASSRPYGAYEPFDTFLYSWYSPSASEPVPGRFATVCVLPAGAPNHFVTAIEYFNATFGHYFVTPLQSEIDALDQGRFPGWVRTGQSFRTFGEGTLSTAPVCRYFREDVTSHFYSASIAECESVRNFSGWIFETAWLFSALVPDDLTTGACKTGLTPLYRLWNAKVNHRYTTSLDVRAQMIAQGYIPEGYGPLGVAMCVGPSQ